MTLDDFRLLVARISLAAPMGPALIPVKITPSVPRDPRQPARSQKIRPT